MRGKKRRTRGLTWLGGVNIAIALILVLGAPIHTVDTYWSPHASVHLAQALIWLVGLCGMNLVLVLVPLRRGEIWAWWTLLGSGLMLFGGYAVPFWLFLGLGLFDAIGLALLAGTYGLGLGLAWRGCRREVPSRSTSRSASGTVGE